MIISAHQPGYFPWIGLIKKIQKSDCFVVLDNVQFNKNSFQNRTLIKSVSGEKLWISVPVLSKGHQINDGIKIRDLKIDKTQKFNKKHLKSFLFSYKKAEAWYEHEEFLRKLYLEKNWTFLLDINMETINYLLGCLKIKRKIILASDLDCSGKKSELILNICKKLSAKTYLSGIGAKNYMKKELFEDNSIDVIYQNLVHPVYPQLHSEFIDGMSTMDLLLNCGNKSIDYLG